MTQEPGGDYLALVIRLQPDGSGEWLLSVDGTDALPPRPLPPTTLVVRLSRSQDGSVLRGMLGLGQQPDAWAPFQASGRLVDLLKAWLGGPGESFGRAEPAEAAESAAEAEP